MDGKNLGVTEKTTLAKEPANADEAVLSVQPEAAASAEIGDAEPQGTALVAEVEEETPEMELAEAEGTASEALPVAGDDQTTDPINSTEAETAEVVAEATGENAPLPSPDMISVKPSPALQNKPKLTKKNLMLIGASAAAVVVAVFLVLFVTVINPTLICNSAVNALEQSNFSECERLLNKIPNNKRAIELKRDLTLAKAKSYIDSGELDLAESMLAVMPGDTDAIALKQDIQYHRASELVERGDVSEAKLILDKIPDHDDPQQLRERISYELALEAVESGDYKTAYDLFSQLCDYSDAAKQKEIVFDEALAFKTIFNLQGSLKDPSSFRVVNITFYEHGESDRNVIIEFTASNSFGGNVGSFGYDLTLYNDSDDSGAISRSDYASPDTLIATMKKLIVDGIKGKPVIETNVDMARMNRLLEKKVSFNIDLPFKPADVKEN